MPPCARRPFASLLTLAALASCDGGNPPRLFGDAPPDGGTDAADAPGSCSHIVGSRRQQVCLRWSCDRADRDEGMFDGDLTSCMPGTVSEIARRNTLRIVNTYRFLADLPEVKDDPTRNGKAQACSLLMAANHMLSHMPPMSWMCWTPDGSEAAGNSNISTAAAVVSVDMYMKDFGNAMTIGHRRWILSNSLGPIGIGSTPGGSCLWVLGGSGTASKPWMAWPPPGPVPFGVFDAGPGGPLDGVGWTVQSDGIDLAGADVKVTRDGSEMLPVQTVQLAPGYGSAHAIRFNPDGWNTAAGHTYHVSVGGVSQPIEYDVQVVGCPNG